MFCNSFYIKNREPINFTKTKMNQFHLNTKNKLNYPNFKKDDSWLPMRKETDTFLN